MLRSGGTPGRTAVTRAVGLGLGLGVAACFLLGWQWPGLPGEVTAGFLSGRAAPRAPLAPEERRTTSSEIALANLRGEISVLQESVARRPGSVRQATMWIERLLTRGSFLGRVADLERALQEAERVVASHPESGAAHVSRARARAALHHFEDALEDVVRAEHLGVPAKSTVLLRVEILAGLGLHGRALEIHRSHAPESPDLFDLAREASLRSSLGEIAEADRLYAEAQHRYDDVSPFPFAWLYFHHGLLWEREGDLERAGEFFEAALERVHGYAPAAAHLAGIEAKTGEPEQAVQRLRSLLRTSDDPRYTLQLADLLERTARPGEAARLRETARLRLDGLITRHPEVFAGAEVPRGEPRPGA